jgi:hypothetical protein
MAGGTPPDDYASAIDYVCGLVGLEGPVRRDNLSEAQLEKADAIETSLTLLIGFAIDADPERADRVRANLRRSFVAALINGVLQARTMHSRIEYEKRALREAEKVKRAVTEVRRWGWRFSHPEHTIRWKPDDKFETPPYREPESGAPPIAPEPENWTAQNFYQGADFRIYLARQRFTLAGVTREIGTDREGRLLASVRHGVGMMALELLQLTPSLRKPGTAWKQLVADIANPVFDQGREGVVVGILSVDEKPVRLPRPAVEHRSPKPRAAVPPDLTWYQ